MSKLFEAMCDFFVIDHDRARRKREEEYLAKSIDLADLERRQRQLMNSNLKGWV